MTPLGCSGMIHCRVIVVSVTFITVRFLGGLGTEILRLEVSMPFELLGVAGSVKLVVVVLSKAVNVCPKTAPHKIEAI